MSDAPGIVFDMDGTLLDTERLSQRAWHESLERFDLAFDPDWYLTLIGRDWPTCERIVHKTFADRVDTRLLTRDLRQTYDRLIAAGVPERAGATQLVAGLAEAGVTLALATSTGTAMAEHKLASTGLRPYFEVVIGGDQVARGKPDPEIYLRAAERLGRPAASCYAVEDTPTGFRAAHAAGMRTLLVPDIVQPPADVAALAHAIARDLPHAGEILTDWLAAHPDRGA